MQGLARLFFYSNSLFYWKYWGWDISTSPSGYGGDCPEGVPVEFGLLSILAAFGAAFGILYMALTIKLGKRRKRHVTALSDGLSCDAGTGSIAGYYGCHLHNFVFGGEDGTYWQQAADLLWHGECWDTAWQPQYELITGNSNNNWISQSKISVKPAGGRRKNVI